MDFFDGVLASVNKWAGVTFAAISLYFLRKFVNDNDSRIKKLEADVGYIKEEDQKRWEKVAVDLAVVSASLLDIVKRLELNQESGERIYGKIEEVSTRVHNQEIRIALLTKP